MAETFADIRFPYNKAGQLGAGNASVNDVRLRRWEYQHEVLVIDAWKADGSALGLKSNAPISARIKGRNASPLSFVGYVHSVRDKVTANRASKRMQRIICVGPTYRMKNGRQKVWRNVTISDIARSLCQQYRLHGVIENHPLRLKSVHQAGESDWAFLCRVAKTYGYVVYPVGTTLYFHSRDYQQSTRLQRAHLLTYADEHAGRTQIWNFDAKFSETQDFDDRKAQRVNANVLPNGGEFVFGHDGLPVSRTRSDTHPGQFLHYDTTTVNDSLAMAKAKAKGASERTRFTYLADAEVDGKPDTAPGSLLYLDKMNNGYDGHWTVIGVEHVFDSKHHYHMNVQIGTDSSGRSALPKPGTLRAVVTTAPVAAQLLTPGGSLQPKAGGGPIGDYLWVAKSG